MNTVLVDVLGFCFLLVVFQVWSHPCFCFWAKIHIHDIIQPPHLSQWVWNNFSFAFYNSPTKVRESHVFSSVWLSVHRGNPIQGPPLVPAKAPLPLHTPSSVQGPLAPPWPHPSAIDIWWSRLETCSNLFPWELSIVLTSGDQEWIHVQTCSLEDPHSADIWWPRLETCSNLFTWILPMFTDIWWLTYEVHGLGKGGTGGTHPTGMLCCWDIKSCRFPSTALLPSTSRREPCREFTMDDAQFIATCDPCQELTSLNLQNLSYVSTCVNPLNMPDYNIILMDTI